MPKAATLSHFNLSNNSRFFGERVGFKQYLTKKGKTARVCLPVPIFHAFGAMLGTSTMTSCPVTIGKFYFKIKKSKKCVKIFYRIKEFLKMF